MEVDFPSLSSKDLMVSATPVGVLDTSRFRKWLSQGFMATMDYLSTEDGLMKREDSSLLLPRSKTLITFLMKYKNRTLDREGYGRIASYASFEDYHKFFPAMIRNIMLDNDLFENNFKIYVDTGPILERSQAERSGLGWIGKCSMLINRSMGSFTLIGAAVSDISINSSSTPENDLCGKCRRCIESCPTHAINEDRTINSNACISYHTIENRGVIPKDIAYKMGNMIFGCDICNDVCPWNLTKKDSSLQVVNEGKFSHRLKLEEMAYLDRDTFNLEYKGSAIKRATYLGLARNSLIAIFNLHQDREEIREMASNFNDLRREQAQIILED